MDISFAQLGLSAPILEALEALEYKTPTPIQMKSIPVLLAGRDLLGQAQTGTGKTAAFALPLLSKLDIKKRYPQVLVLTPTRELAIQIAQAFTSYAKNTIGLHCAVVYGGQAMPIQLKALKNGPQVVVGTPGRVLDHLRRKSLDVSNISALVLDEADEMLKMGFKEELDTILSETPAEKQVALFSATMPREIRRVAAEHLKDAEEIIIKTKTATVETTEQFFCSVSAAEKLPALLRILDVRDIQAAIIFARTKAGTLELCEALEKAGHATAALNGDLTQALRENAINRLKKGQIKLIVATDVAARGLHVDSIDHIINYDVPRDTEAYVHRIGRTGRAGRKGTAILFVTPKEERYLRIIERATRQPIQRLPIPDDATVMLHRSGRLKDRVKRLQSEPIDLAPFEKIVREIATESSLSLDRLAASLCHLMQAQLPVLSNKAASAAKRSRAGGRDSDRAEPRDRSQTRVRREQTDRKERRKSELSSHGEMVLHRFQFGREHGVEVGQIVASICAVTGLTSRHIGNIRLHDDFTTVELPKDLTPQARQALQTVDFDTGLLQIFKGQKDRRPNKGGRSVTATRGQGAGRGGSADRGRRDSSVRSERAGDTKASTSRNGDRRSRDRSARPAKGGARGASKRGARKGPR